MEPKEIVKKDLNFYKWRIIQNVFVMIILFTDGVSASLIKYTINSFLALKVVFFNELKTVFDNLSSNNNG